MKDHNQQRSFYKKIMPYVQQQHFRSNSYSTGSKPGVNQRRFENSSVPLTLDDMSHWGGQSEMQVNDRAASKKLKEHYEYANKSHLTSAPG